MFVSFRLLVVQSIQIEQILIYFRCSVRAARNVESATPSLHEDWPNTQNASISDVTIQMDHNAVVLFTIDRLARSPRDDGTLTEHRKGPRPVVYKINLRFRRFSSGMGQVIGLSVSYI